VRCSVASKVIGRQQQRLGAVQRLDLGLLVDTEHDRATTVAGTPGLFSKVSGGRWPG
jgi:hypothetical protein